MLLIGHGPRRDAVGGGRRRSRVVLPTDLNLPEVGGAPNSPLQITICNPRDMQNLRF